MQIVIEIPEDVVNMCYKMGFIIERDREVVSECIRNGTPLPKGHGRLIDADRYLEVVCTYKETGCGSCKLQTTCLQDVPTIIEADEEVAE